MPDETKAATLVENMPSVAGEISALASANAPFIYFEEAAFFGVGNGVGKVALTAARHIASKPDGGVFLDKVIVAHLVGSIPAVRALKGALDKLLLLAEPKPEGPAN